MINPRGGDFYLATSGDHNLAVDSATHAAERHLVIVLDSCSQPGMGIPLGLTDRNEPGAAACVMPSIMPPEPLTHVWLLPTMAASEGLRWTHGGGWMVLEASAP